MPIRPRILPVLALAAILAAGAASSAAAVADDGSRIVRPATQPERDEPTTGERAARIAVSAVGVPYRWGGESPVSGFDCSGLVRWAYGRVGVDVPHSSYALSSFGRKVALAALEPGDVLLFEGLGHVGLYLGGGRMVHAPQSGRHVEVVRLGRSGYGGRVVAARRVTA